MMSKEVTGKKLEYTIKTKRVSLMDKGSHPDQRK